MLARTDNDGYSGDRYSGNDGYSGLNPLDDAILFTVSGITVIADKKFGYFGKNMSEGRKMGDFDKQSSAAPTYGGMYI